MSLSQAKSLFRFLICSAFLVLITIGSVLYNTSQKTGRTIILRYIRPTYTEYNSKNDNVALRETMQLQSQSKNGTVGSCPETPPGLKGYWVPRTQVLESPELESKHPELSAGGRWAPDGCKARHKLAILIPYRDRSEHLHIFLNNMHDFLQRQQLDYGIYVIEQAGETPFNRGKLFNVGYNESLQDYLWECIALHDVDHIPLNDTNLYTCPPRPRHLSAFVDKWKIGTPYKGYFGGVNLLKTEHYKEINGMTNIMWGWGGEDDDLGMRVHDKKLSPVMRYPGNIGAYMTIRKFHMKAKVNPLRFKQLAVAVKRAKKDGLNSLQYKLISKTYKKLYTHILVDLLPVNLKS